MTRKRNRCVLCDSFDTERLHIEWFSDMIEEVRGCNNCRNQFVNEYSMSDRYELEEFL
jgi:hypothetical protein